MTEQHAVIPWPSRYPFGLIASLILFVFVVGMTSIVQFHLELNALQRYYLRDLLQHKLAVKFHQAAEKHRWISVQLADGTFDAAKPDDITDGFTDYTDGSVLSVQHSLHALHSGRQNIYLMPAKTNETGAVDEWFRETIYPNVRWKMFLYVPLVAGLVVLIVAVYMTLPYDRQRAFVRKFGRRLRGPEHVSVTEFVRRLHSNGVGFLTRMHGLFKRGAFFYLRIPLSSEAEGIMMSGNPGMGKSVLLHQLLGQIAENGERAIVLDVATEFVQLHMDADRGDIVLNPADLRCPYWELEKEVTHEAETRTIARSMNPPKHGESPFFVDAAQRLLAHLLKYRPSAKELSEWLAKPAEIDKRIQGTELAAMLDKQAAPQRAGVLGTLAMFGDALRILPSKDDALTTWNTAEWTTGNPGWLFLTSVPMIREQIRPLQTCWIDLLILRLMNANNDTRKKTWIILDELASLQYLPQLVTALTENRKSGNPLVIAFQGKSQVETIYGPIAETMLSVLATKVFFRTSEPRSSKWVSDSIGNVEYELLRESESTHPNQGRSRSEHTDFVTRPLVMPEEIAGLPRFQAYVKHDNLVTEIETRYLNLPVICAGFLPRPSLPPAAPSNAPLPGDNEGPLGNGLGELMFR